MNETKMKIVKAINESELGAMQIRLLVADIFFQTFLSANIKPIITAIDFEKLKTEMGPEFTKEIRNELKTNEDVENYIKKIREKENITTKGVV